ncbi:MAG: hypothetical protein L6Q68_06170 [Aquabacterium sp.]|jgi:hypothetical protein|nr:hypothetical protein [Aquabacterium sp.]
MPRYVTTQTAASIVTPWWRVGMVWLVIGGPLVVVVAAVATAVIAYTGADSIVSDPEAVRQATTQPVAATPAIQARNHAATASQNGR